jgi:serine/threonine protein kinase
MEYMPMNLEEFIKQHVRSSDTREFPFTPMAALHIISQIASGMDYLHLQDVVHRDLKPNNILVSPIDDTDLAADGYGDVKLCDFGLAKLKLTSQTEEQSRVCGGRYWRAPEAYPEAEGRLPRYRTKEADAYSFAIVCSQILSGASCPFPDPWDKLTERISAPRNERPHLPSDTYPPKLLDLIKRCWDPHPERRPSFSDICKTLQDIKLVLLGLY